MTTFTCPRHGPYERNPDQPARIVSGCRSCIADARAQLEQTQQQIDAEISTWLRWQAADLPERYRNRTVENWHPQRGQEPTATMVLSWLERLDSNWDAGDGLLLMGAPGVGKTHLLTGLVTAIVQQGYQARYASWPAVWEKCRPPFDENPDELLRELASVPFLALDELGMRPGTDKEQARLFELIDTRYRDEVPTLVATNATEATLPMIGERTADRLLEACIPVVIPGSSYRSRAAVDRGLREAPPALIKPTHRTITVPVSVEGVDEQRDFTTKWDRGSLRA